MGWVDSAARLREKQASVDDNDEYHEATLSGSVVCNSKYAVDLRDHGVHIRRLDDCGSRPQCLVLYEIATKTAPILALSPIRLDHLAISQRDNVIIYDLDTGEAVKMFPGSGRAITALAWSPLEDGVLASGCVDGSVCIWDLSDRSSVSKHLAYTGGSCDSLAISPHGDNAVASAHGGTIVIWSLSRSRKPVKTIRLNRGSVTALAWHTTLCCRLLATSNDDKVRVWDVTEALSAVPLRTSHDDDSDDEGVFGQLDGLQRPTFPIAEIDIGTPIKTAAWIGEHGVLVHSQRKVRFYSFGTDWELIHEVWHLDLDFNASACVVRGINGSTSLNAVSTGRTQSFRIPSAVLDGVGGHVQPVATGLSTGVQDFALQPLSSTATVANTQPVPRPTKQQTYGLRPVSITQTRSMRGNFQRTSRQIKQKRDSRREKMQRSTVTAKEQLPPSQARSATPVSQAMTSSLELPKLREKDNESPMPFLSPSIPSRKPSPNTLPPIDDVLHLPPSHHASFDTLPSTAAHESDSDDETFAGDMRGSTTFMPGGINVPLPKACGALFGPNGQLLTFFPPKPPPRSARGETLQSGDRGGPQDKARRVARLFPTFGNLTADDLTPDDDSENGAYESAALPGDDRKTSRSFSNQSQLLWPIESSPTKQSFAAQNERRVLVCTHDLDGLLPSQQDVAESYRILCNDVDSGSDICRHNAQIARDAGQAEAADIWRLLGMVLADKVSLQGEVGSENKTSFVARIAMTLLPTSTGAPSMEGGIGSDCFGKIRWSDGPFGGAWLIRQCFEWVESRADMQMLANMSAVLAHAESLDLPGGAFAQPSIMARLPTHGLDYGLSLDGTYAAPAKTKPIPVLRTSSLPDGKVYEPPTKSRLASRPSSRKLSHPSTPYLNSAASTPPLSLPTISRQSTKLSISGSASPEHSRSSFSAAARQYAQSITDRFATYGTSPPMKKPSTSTSPSMNELSSSLPIGSWSKSVSFASTAGTTRDRQLSKSYIAKEEGDDYDSDKTFDEGSLPHTPKSTNAPVVMTKPNHEYFADDVSGAAKAPLLSQELRSKGMLWRAHYSEQLRCWGLLTQAAEMGKVSGLTEADLEDSATRHMGVAPARIPGMRKPTCSVCTTVITDLHQLCPACLHSTHMACLQSYLECLEPDEAYECPSACGCACASLSFEPTTPSVAAVDKEDPVAAPKQHIKRKPSFTDPRRWRAKIEGDSW